MPIVVVGGGPAGAVAALTLAGRGHDVMIVDATAGPVRKVGECLSPGSASMLDMLGLRDGMERAGHLASPGNRSFWGSSTAAEHDFLFGRQGHGWHLDRARFEADLVSQAVAAGVRWHPGHRLRAARYSEETWQLVLDTADDQRLVETDYVVDATGRTRTLARTLVDVHAAPLPGAASDRLLGLAGVFSSSGERDAGVRDRRTVVEATEFGWWYSALLAGGDLVAVAMTDADLMPADDAWDTLLAPAEETRRRIACHGGRLAARPRARLASGSRLARCQGPGWIAVGDAALAFDPLSSYGITSAMGTAYYAAHAVADTLAGDTKAAIVYEALLEQTWERYLGEHAAHYALEDRWPDRPFWSRRLRRDLPTDELGGRPA